MFFFHHLSIINDPLYIRIPFIVHVQLSVYMEFYKSFTPNHTPKAFFRAIYYSPSVKWPFAKCRLDTVTFQTNPLIHFNFSFHFYFVRSSTTSRRPWHLTAVTRSFFITIIVNSIKKYYLFRNEIQMKPTELNLVYHTGTSVWQHNIHNVKTSG